MEKHEMYEEVKKKFDQQQNRLENLRRKLDEQDRELKGLDFDNEIKDIREEVIALKDKQQTTRSEVTTLRTSRENFAPIFERLQQTQAQTDTDVRSLTMDQEKIKRKMADIKEWQKKAASIASRMGEQQKQVKESVLEKDKETWKLVKELHQIMKTELQEKSKFRAEFTLLQSYNLPVPGSVITIDDFNKVKLACQYFDSTTGKYTAPMRGIYKFTINIKLGSKGRVHFNLMCESGDTLARVNGAEVCGKYEGYRKEFLVNCKKGEKVWVEVKNMEANSEIFDCHFCGELMPELEEIEENEVGDDDDDENHDDDNNDVDESELQARRMFLNLLLDM